MAHESDPPQKKPVKRVVKRVVRKPVSKPAPQPVSKPAPPPSLATTPRVRLRDRFELPGPSRLQMPTAPRLAPATACALGGLLVGAFAVAATLVVMALLNWLRGTPAGGGWGLVALVLILMAAVILGVRALTWLGVPEPGATSFVGVLVVLAVILGVLLDLALTTWAVGFVPLLGAVTFTVVNSAICHLAPATKD